ncbi:YicC family protein [Synergistales bacterium]|nr:YicC family protein [Synergistales bacterium]
MYVSMTGFSRASASFEWGTIHIELSSVNHRYQEISARLPRELASWEPWFHKKMQKLYGRGKVSIRAEITWAGSVLAASINKDALKKYYDEITEAQKFIGVYEEIAVDRLLDLPGVVGTQKGSGLSDDEATEAILWGLLSEAAEKWQTMRDAEGEHLKRAVEEHIDELERLLSRIAERWKIAKDAAFENMTERVTKALSAAGLQADDSRFAQEAVFIADRWDISEELARLNSHIEKFRETGNSGDPIGRKLDFIVQEMNREVNTLDSKTADSEVRWMAVEAKTALERVREQIQNLE